MLNWPQLHSRANAAYRRARAWIVQEESGPRSPQTPKRRGGLLGPIAAIFVAAIAVFVLVLATLDWNTMRGPVSRYLSARLERELRIEGDLEVALFSWTPTATLNRVVVQQPEWVNEQYSSAESFAEIERLIVSVDLLELLTGDLVLPEFAVTRPAMRLIRDASGRANWLTDPEQEDTGPRLPAIRHFVLQGGKLDFIDDRKKLFFVGTFSSEERESGAGNNFQLDGDGQLNRRPFKLEMTGDPLLNVDPDKPYGFKSEIRAGATEIVSNGALSRPFDFANFNVNVEISGSDLAELYYLTGLALPNTAPYRVSGELTRQRAKWRLENLNGKVGDSDMRGVADIDASGERTYLKADLASRQLDFDDLGPVFGLPPGAGAGETASPEQKREASQKAAAARVLSDKPLDVERLRQMDADVHYRADKIQSRDFPLRAGESQISLRNGVLKLAPATMSFAQGVMTGTLQIDARKDIAATDLDVRLSKLQLQQFVSGLGSPPALEGEVLARAKLHGIGNSVHDAASSSDGSFAVVVPRGQIRERFAELLGINIARALLLNGRDQTDLRCAVAEFSAKDGILNLNQFEFDTEVVRVSAEGRINLKTETLDLRLTGHPKAFRLVRVRGPITIGGPISKPTVGLDAGGAIAQGGLAAGLGALISPLAAILPFIDAGLAKDANCAGVLNRTRTPVADASRRPR
jgi:AsmA family protein